MDCQIAEQIFAVIRCLQEEQKKPKDYGIGQPLYHSEVMFLETIQRNPDANVSQLSYLMGITKGAVTQLACRLMEKGLIEIYKRDGNKKEKFYCLTPLGEAAEQGHAQFHADSNAKLCSYFSSLSIEDSAVIFNFLKILEECAPFSQFTCTNYTAK